MTLKLKLIEKDMKTGPHECELISRKLQLGKYTVKFCCKKIYNIGGRSVKLCLPKKQFFSSHWLFSSYLANLNLVKI